ncbi:multiple sugar transport system substrate-binding protein [Bacillus sp. SLBN-46]|uniref:ABC transporter substrate-binding protein n=1 Tax=Bacillus sp. SLBN-46 TaxID=3042283 RepID=UPI00285C8BD0|nr:sugar ABC transporter substrate-binding protein [Bacillus sp. SLBN-46]MDR6125268.1 multiple sugar transport system substrate-binding protein [Bacillus sp. SLBN-46]
MKRFAVTLLVILTLVISLVGCGKSETASGSGNKSGGKTTITFGFWGAAEDLKVYTKAAKDISKEYPNIELKVKQYPSSEQFWNNLPGEIAAGVAPDFIKISNEGAYEYINKGLFAPLDDLTASAKVDMKRYNQAGADIWKVDGKQYGLPFNQMPAMFFINTEMWKNAGLGEYPKTWDEVEAAAKKLKTKDVYGLGLNLHPLHITNVTKSYGGDWGNGKTINSPENIEGLQKVLDLYKKGLAVTPKTLGYGWDGEVFANGKAAMTTGGNWYKGYLKDANPNLKYTVIPIPKGTVNASTMISDAYVVLKDTKHKKEALQAAYYLTNENVQKDFMKTGVNPSIPSLSAQYFEENPEFKEVQKAIEYSTDFGYPKETKKFNDELIKQLEDVILGGNDKSAKEILDSIQKQF